MSQPVIGKPLDRADGRDKVMGRAKYTGDRDLDGMLHAVVVPSSIAKGRVVSIDDSRARAARGVVAIMTHLNAPRVKPQKSGEQDAVLYLLQDDRVTFDRQPVAVAIARTFEEAVHAADLVNVTYAGEAPVLAMSQGEIKKPEKIFGEPADHTRGNPAPALAGAQHKVAHTYRTPTEHHNPMEPHGTIAAWDGDRLTLHDSTQWAFGVRTRMAAVFGIEPERIRVIAPFVGGAFGSKGTAWSHVALAAMAAKLANAPVKLLLTRPQMFGWVGHRPQTEQDVAIAAESNGSLIAFTHDVRNETSIEDDFIEPSAVFSRDLYAVPNYRMTQELHRLNISKPTYQRAPGESTGSFAAEAAMDELAYQLNVDPLELRLRNYSERNPNNGKEYTSKKLRQCYEQAAEKFGWSKRTPAVGSMKNGRMLVGLGMATSSRATHRSGASMRATMTPDGRVLVQSGTIEQGTGSSTVYAQLVAEILEIPHDRVRFEWGDTMMPEAPLAAGSQTAASLGSVAVMAATQLKSKLHENGGRVPTGGIVVDAKTTIDEEEEEKYAQQAFGANFAEVQIDPDLRSIRVTRFTGAYDGGRILNEKTARSQFLGGIVWGISMALFEETQYDHRSGRIMNATLEKYLVPTNADIPNPEIIIVADDDERVNPAHVRGIGEVGMVGSAAAIANAVYHATGVRVYSLPIRVEDLLT
jgi:xanthine dehydrogenase YagR molybdenum-binding subunit